MSNFLQVAAGKLANWVQPPTTMPDRGAERRPWPRLTIITPSFNQGHFIDKTIRSVLDQHYPNLEYIIMDGGSTDRTVDILQKYSNQLAYWTSAKDEGQADAINKGMKQATGDWVAWINSDDYYLPGAFTKVMSQAMAVPECTWIAGHTLMIQKRCLRPPRERLFKARLECRATLANPDYQRGSWLDFVCTKTSGLALPQPSSFWSRTAWEGAGGLDAHYHYAMDHEFYGRLAHAGHRPHIVNTPLSVFRVHSDQKTTREWGKFQDDELRVLTKWMDRDITAEERKMLSHYRDFLETHFPAPAL